MNYNEQCPHCGRRDAPPREQWRHVKSGNVYSLLHIAVFEWSGDCAYVYEGEDGDIWVRPATEFLDGRFVKLDAAPQPAAQTDGIPLCVESVCFQHQVHGVCPLCKPVPAAATDEARRDKAVDGIRQRLASPTKFTEAEARHCIDFACTMYENRLAQPTLTKLARAAEIFTREAVRLAHPAVTDAEIDRLAYGDQLGRCKANLSAALAERDELRAQIERLTAACMQEHGPNLEPECPICAALADTKDGHE